MIYTVTFNPSIDYVVQTDDFQQGKVNRTTNEHKYAGGKGINVSRVLKNLGIESKALGFIGGFTGEFIDSFLKDRGIKTDFIRVNEDTRINIKLKSKVETEINASGPNISKEELHKFFLKVDELKEDDFLVLAGNAQKSLPTNIYALIQDKCKGKGIKVVVDTTGESLTSSLKYSPFLIKPNNHELSEIFKTTISSKEEIIDYGKKLVYMGAQNVIISMAGDGAILICDRGVYLASVPKGKVQNSVGAGDSLVGGFLAEYSKASDILNAFKLGVASGSATAFSMDLCKENEVYKLVKEVKLTQII